MSDQDLWDDPFREVDTVTLQQLLEDVFADRIELDFEGRDPFSGEGALTVNSCIFDEDRPLHVVARRGNTSCLKLLLDAGADPNALGDMSLNPLHAAVREGQLECAQILLKAGARTDAIDEFDQTPLDLCKRGGWYANPEMFKMLSAGTLEHLRAGLLRGAVKLELELECGLEQVPEEIRDLADSLEILDLSGNRLTDLPDWLPELRKLKVFFGSNNPFLHVPEVLGECPALEMVGFKSCQIGTLSGKALPLALRWLILTNNQLTSLPEELGRRPRLQKLMLSGNRLSALPDSMAACRNLELLRLAANQFETLPDWISELPGLAWLAVSGNPCTPFSAANDGSPVPEIPWSELVVGKLLGEGASGHIYEAQWVKPGAETPARNVAIKLFKGAMTSDGLPASEMAASLAASGHPQLLGALGKITGHPDGTNGLVMALVDPSFTTLGIPPSLETCTRDIYPHGYPGEVRFTEETAGKLLLDLASAATHLHQRRVLHGDFYAHNVMWHKPTGQALLGDFGAASCYPPGPPEKWEQIEVRAFGILMQEVLDRCPDRAALPENLSGLPGRCQQPDVAARPGFRELSGMLEGWATALRTLDAPP